MVAWHLRLDTLDLLKEKLGFEHEGPEILPGGHGEEGLADSLGIASLSAMGLDARYFRIQWNDGRIGRLRISNTGIVMRAVVMGDKGRDKVLEVALTGGNGRVENVVERLKECTTPRRSSRSLREE